MVAPSSYGLFSLKTKDEVQILFLNFVKMVWNFKATIKSIQWDDGMNFIS